MFLSELLTLCALYVHRGMTNALKYKKMSRTLNGLC